MRWKFITAFACVITLTALSCGGDKRKAVVVAAPFGPLAYPLVYMAENHDTAVFPEPIELKIWKNPDQLRAMIAGEQADFFAVPTNVAAVFHNKGVDFRLTAVSVWSVLWVVSSDSTKTTLDDFTGEEIVMPFRGDMPHIVFANLARQRGLNPDADFSLRFVNTPQDAVQQLLMGRADHAVLCEPDISILFHASEVRGNAGTPSREFLRAVDLQEEWDAVYHTGEEIPIGGIAITGATAENPRLIEKFLGEYARAIDWCENHPTETGRLTTRFFEGVEPEPIEEAMGHVRQKFVAARDARQSVETFFTVLREGNPATIGGSLPGDGFYWDNTGKTNQP